MSNEDRGASAGSVIVSFLAGAAIGSGLALLFAPKSGRELREQIKDLTDDAVDKIKEYSADAQERIRTTMEEGKDMLREKKSLLTSAIEAGREAMGKERERMCGEQKERPEI